MTCEMLSTCPASCGGEVLVVDDDFDVRTMLVEVLGLEGYRVHGADGGRNALSYLRHGGAPALILLDLLMPDMDGWEFRNAQLQDRRLAEIPVVVFTADSHADEAASALGVSRGVRKPFDLDQLLAVIGQHCVPA